MKTIKLTAPELRAFKEMCNDCDLYSYVSYTDSGGVLVNEYSNLLRKLDIYLENYDVRLENLENLEESV